MRKMFSEKQIETMITKGSEEVFEDKFDEKIQVVDELPTEPVANVIYLVKEV